jgi:tetratricopeptide (TPR) repeat protein
MVRRSLQVLLIVLGCTMVVWECGEDPNIKSKQFVQKGLQFYKNNDYDKAIAAYKQAIEVNPGNAFAHYYLGVLFKDYTNMTDHMAAAVKELEAAIFADVNFMDAYIMLASIHMKTGDYEKAEDVAKRAIKANNDDPEGHYWLAQSYNMRQMYPEAKDECKRALKADPNHAAARALLLEVEQNLL